MKTLKCLLFFGALLCLNFSFAQQTNVFPDNGKVGIGTLSPTTNLHILRNNWAGLRIESTKAGTDPALFLKALGGEWSFYNDDSGKNKLSLRFSNVEKLGIDTSGQMTIKSNGWNHLDIKAKGVGADAAIRLYDDNDLWSLHHDDSEGNQFDVRYNNSQKMVINTSGYMGLGISTPKTNLHILRNGWAGLRVESAKAGTDPVLFLKAKGGEWALHNDDSGNNDLDFRFDNSTKLYLSKDGKLGLNTTKIPIGYQMAVNGKVICEELKVQLASNWPDYVFEDSYKLRSLAELKAYIQQNKHLPGVPSAQEIAEADGIEVGEMQRMMMEKIEELTLYVIELGEENKQLKDRLGKMEDQKQP